MIPEAYARGLYFTLQWWRREPVAEALEDVRRTEFMTADALRALQARRQLEQLRFVRRHVPHFRELLAPVAELLERDLSWDQVREVLEGLPIIEKGSTLQSPERYRADNEKSLATHPDRTSGSSGTPLVFPCDQRAWAYRHALTFRGMEAFGVRVGEPYGLFFGLHWNRRRRLVTAIRDRILNRVRVSAFEIGPTSFERHLRLLRRGRPTHLLGYPSALFGFCALAKDRGVDLAELGLKAVFTTAEPLRPHQRSLIESVTGSRCVNVYGSAEGGLMATECPAGRLHICAEAVWVGVRPGTGPLGECIATDMMLRAFPLIRYGMGDEIELAVDPCPCGRAHPVIARVEGRSGDGIELRGGRRLNANVPSYIFKPLADEGVVRQYRFLQAQDGKIRLQVVATSRFARTHREILDRELRKVFEEEAPAIELVDALPALPNAKHRDFVRI